MNNLLKEDYNILNFENVTKNFEKKIYMKNLIILFLWMKKNNQKKK